MFKSALLPSMAALIFGVTALPAESVPLWSATATKATDVSHALHVGPMKSGDPLHIVLSLNLHNEAELDNFVHHVKSSPGTQPLSSQQIMSRYMPNQADVNAVTGYLRTQGFTNIVVSANHLLVQADGTAGTIANAFHADMHSYQVDGRVAHANVSDAVIPTSLSGIVRAVHGLQTVHVHHLHTQAAPAMSLAGGIVLPILMRDFDKIYNAASLPPATRSVVGIIGVGDMSQTLNDLNAFVKVNNFTLPAISVLHVGTPSTDTSGVTEWNMDSQAILSAAGGSLGGLIFYAAHGWDNASLLAAYNEAMTQNVAKVINVSLGECEYGPQSDGTAAASDAVFKLAVAQGQTFSVSAGDSGAFECGGSGAYQSSPAVSPYVMAMGGTRIYGTGPTMTIAGLGALSPAYSLMINPYTGMLQEINTYVGETVWTCANSAQCPSHGGTGGGISATESASTWQIAAGVLKAGSTQRGVPDLAFNADPQSGAIVAVYGSYTPVGGTSLASPLFVGFWARIQSLKADARTLGYPGTYIYQHAAANPGWFHDVTAGSNGAYRATVGWDYTTGFGSMNIANFANSFAQ